MDQEPNATAKGALAQVRKSIARFTRKAGLRKVDMPERPSASGRRQAVELKEYAVPFDRQAFPRRAVLRLSAPRLGKPSVNAVFAEHPLSADGEASERVLALHNDSVFESLDLGTTWREHKVETQHPLELAFTTSSGHVITCTQPMAGPQDIATRTVIRRYDRDWRPAGDPIVVNSPWHGTASIGEAGGVIMFAEYPLNRDKYPGLGVEGLSPATRLMSSPRVFRSRDDGRTWEVAFEVPVEQVRHLHTCMPEPGRPGRWWLTSGDRHDEIHVWVSEDDGDSWSEITSRTVKTPLHVSCRPVSTQRMTDHVFHDGWMLWGADDILGKEPLFGTGEHPRVGSRIFRARAEGPFEPEEIGFCGSPLRSIVDVGPAFLFTSEAKKANVALRPRTYLVFKDELDRVHPFVELDNYAETGTGFTYSRHSRKARDGVFYTYRGAADVFPRSPRLLRWEIEFA